MKTIAIGYDQGEAVAFHTLVHSIMLHSSGPISIIPIIRSSIPEFTRPRGPLDSTEFSISRFLTPYLCGYEGVALFMDCDIVVVDDVYKLFDCFDSDYAVQVVKHNHRPLESIKMDDRIQSAYQMKNWSSVMLFNNAKCKALTLDYVNTAHGLDLHQFQWLEEPRQEVGELPPEWNHLVGYSSTQDPAAYHYTTGGPWFDKYRDCESNEVWHSIYEKMNYPYHFWALRTPRD